MQTQSTLAETPEPIRWDVFDALCNAKGWTNDLTRATRLGFSHSHLSRLRSGKVQLGREVLDKMLVGLNVPYEAIVKRADS